MDILPSKYLDKYNSPEKRKIGLMINESTRLISEGQFIKAITICDDALQLDSTDALVLTQKGVACSRLGSFDEAMLCFKSALKSEPNLADAWYNIATVKALQNNVDEAISSLKRAINLDSRFMKVAKTDEEFLYLRNNPNFIVLVGN